MLFEGFRDHPADGRWRAVVDVRPKDVILVDLAYAPAGAAAPRISDSELTDVPKVRIMPGFGELITDGKAKVFEQDVQLGAPRGVPPGMQVAWQKMGEVILYSLEPKDTVQRREEEFWFPEAACVARGFLALHAADIARDAVVHAHVCPEGVHAFLYVNGSPVFYQGETFGDGGADAERNLENAFRELARRIKGTATVYISGWRSEWDFDKANWMWSSFLAAGISYQVQWVNAEKAVKANASVTDFGKIEIGFAAHQTALAIYGAAVMLREQWGADFGGGLSPTPVAPPSRLRNARKRLAAVTAAAPPLALGAVLAVALTAVPLGVKFRNLQRERADLEVKLSQETARERELADLKTKADEIDKLIKNVEGVNEQIKSQLPLQKLPAEALAALRETWVRGVVLKKAAFRDGRLELSGEVTFGSVYGSSKKAAEGAEAEPTPFFDPGALIAQFALNLKQNAAFADVVANTKTIDPQKTEFTISCAYPSGANASSSGGKKA